MNSHKPSEIDLFLKLNSNVDLARVGLTFSLRRNYGVVAVHKGRPLGVWGYPDERLCFRHAQTWEAVIEVSSIGEAIDATMSMVGQSSSNSGRAVRASTGVAVHHGTTTI